MSFYIKKATAADIPLLAQLSETTFYDTYNSTHLRSDLEDYVAHNLTEQAINKDFENEEICYLLLYMEDEVAGYAKLDSTGADELPPQSKNPLEIARIYLLKTAQGKGLGKKLMENTIQYAIDNEHDAVYLAVWEGNTQAIAFYNNRGFAIYGETTFVMKSTTDRDWLMVKHL